MARRIGLSHMIHKDKEVRYAVEILNRKGFGGKAVYVPKLYDKRTLSQMIQKMLEKGMSEQEIAGMLGVHEELVRKVSM